MGGSEGRPKPGMEVKERNEAALVARALGGESAAFEDLLRPYEARVYHVVRRITRNHADAADVYQEAVLRAFEKLSDYKQEAAFGTWLHRIAVNCALMRLRSSSRSPLVLEDDAVKFNWMGMHTQPVQNWAESAEAPAERAEMRAALSEALEGLSDVDRAIVLMKDAEGLSHEEIAAATGLSPGAARTRLHRARLSLRARLEERFGEKP